MMKKIKKRNLYLTVLAAAVAIPVMTAQVPAEHAQAAQSKGAVVIATDAFKDVKISNPYYQMIHEMRDAGIIRGYEDGTFRPNTTISREHAAALVSRALTINDLTLDKKVEFKQPKDLSTSSPYYDDIKMLIEAGLLKTDAKGNINPKVELKRGEMAKILAVAFNLEVKADYVFQDVKGSEYEEYVKALYSNGVTTGYEDYTFKLDNSLTRVHYVLFMHRAMNLDNDFVAEPIPTPTPKPDPKPTPTPKPEPSSPTSDSPIKYSDWSRDDIKTKIPRPKGYVAGEHEKKNAEIVKGIIEENKHGFTSSFTIESNSSYYSSPEEFEAMLRSKAEVVEATYETFVEAINWAIDTGEVYDGKTFSVYFNYENGLIYLSGIRTYN
ncbi:S-layer homology domain-containing protein [Lysinibacillus sp. FSL K6-0232]|uniref:S-layer homology domain-containing protein n=1 Tax=Lysinibacillus sp. FSL K6-0232 TaxID=2921425 RepID=UPI0030F86141